MWSLDVLAEKKVAVGEPTFEAAFYKYSLGAPDCGSGEPGAPACLPGENVVGQVDGKATLLGGAWLIPQTVGWGQLQPFVRFQHFKPTLSITPAKQFDIGVNN